MSYGMHEMCHKADALRLKSAYKWYLQAAIAKHNVRKRGADTKCFAGETLYPLAFTKTLHLL